MIRYKYDSETKSFSIAEPINKTENQDFLIVYKDAKNNAKQKKIKAKSMSEALTKFRQSIRINLTGGIFYQPRAIRVFRLPDQESQAMDYRSSIERQ